MDTDQVTYQLVWRAIEFIRESHEAGVKFHGVQTTGPDAIHWGENEQLNIKLTIETYGLRVIAEEPQYGGRQHAFYTICWDDMDKGLKEATKELQRLLRTYKTAFDTKALSALLKKKVKL